MPIFHTERPTLRPFCHDDWQRLQHDVSQEIVTRYDHAYPTSGEDCQGICYWFAQEAHHPDAASPTLSYQSTVVHK